jgi:hypothetical protein
MCHPEAHAEGSLGTGVPWEDKKKSVPREDIPKPRPERSGGASLTLGRTGGGGGVSR